jgi:hypothetical protein
VPFWRRLSLGSAVVLALGLCTSTAGAFPPYRSTDAATADAGNLEVRFGLGKVEHEESDNSYSTPLLRANLGLLRNLELISEFGYRPEEDRLSDGAVAGFKWVPFFRQPFSLGVETLALLPVSSGLSGVGVASQLLATFRRDDLLLHLNAGGFYDPRPRETERGWRASALAELQRGRWRPGLELFATQVDGRPAQIAIGPGVIVDLGPVDVRAGVHFGLTSAAPDVRATLWVTWKVKLW